MLPESIDATSTAGGPLAGVRVVEFAGQGPGPFGGMMLADFGADVVRIDRPADGHVRERDVVLGRGKRSISLDLKMDADLDVARRLVDRADVLIDPFRPGVAERLGLGPEACLASNPRLVYARMTGWGQEGPLASSAGHDISYIGLAGALHPIGPADRPPTVPLNLIGDYGGGALFLVVGVTCALLERERSGHGQVVDVAMVDGVATLLALTCQLAAAGQWSHERGRNWLDGSAPWYASYATADGQFLSVGALEPQFYAELLSRLGLDAAEWPQWDQSRWKELREQLGTLFRTAPLARWRALLEGTDACFAPVLTLEGAFADEHLAARGTFVVHDGAVQPAPAPRFGRTPGAIQGLAPMVGQHDAEIRADVGT